MSLDSYEIMGGKNRDYQPYLKASWRLKPINHQSRWWQLKYFWNFHPENLGKMNPFLLIFFRWVETTN